MRDIVQRIRRRFCKHRHKTYVGSHTYWEGGCRHRGGEYDIQMHLVDVFVCDRCGMGFETEIGGRTK